MDKQVRKGRLALLGLSILAGLLLATGFRAEAGGSAQLGQAIGMFQQGQYVEAQRQFNDIAKSGDSGATASYYEALCWQKLNQTGKYEQILSDICRRFPGSPEAGHARRYLEHVRPQTATARGTSPGASTGYAQASTPTLGAGSSAAIADFKHGSVNIPFIREKGWLVVDAKVGYKSMKMVFDTGFPNSVVQPENFPGQIPANAPSIYVSTAYGGTVGRLVNVEIEAGGFRRTTQVAVARIKPAVNILGKNFLDGYAYEVNRASISVQPKPAHTTASKAVADKFSVPYEVLSDGHMRIEMSINGEPIPAIFDTGAAIDGILVHRSIIEQNPKLRAYFSSYMHGRPVERVNIGPIQKLNVMCHLNNSFGTVALVGPSVFGDRRFVIDTENHLIRFQY